MRITAYVTGVIPVIAVAMRFASRYLGGNPFWWDDWIHFVSAVSPQIAAAQLLYLLTTCQVLVYPTLCGLRAQHQCGDWKAHMGLDVSTCL